MEQQWKPILNLFLQGKSPEIEKKKQENSDGTFRWLKWEIKHWLAVDGSIGGLMMSCIDITKEKNIILNEKLFQSFMAYLRGLCWITDSNNHLKYANSQFIEKFNLTPGVIGKKHEEIFGLDLARVSHQCNMNVLNTKQNKEYYQTIRDQNGHPQYYKTYKIPFLRNDGQDSLVGFISLT